jgi:hypothetical protein
MKLFAKATQPQKMELHLFLGNFCDHANTSNWTGNTTVATASCTDQDLAVHYGKITMTNNKRDFVGPITHANMHIKGINGISKTCFRGIVKWSFEDTNRRRHNHLILGAYCCPDLPCHLLSPQHWAQTRNDNSPKKGGTICETCDDRVTLCRSQQRFKLTVPLDRNSNVAYIHMVTGFDKFADYCKLTFNAMTLALSHQMMRMQARNQIPALTIFQQLREPNSQLLHWPTKLRDPTGLKKEHMYDRLQQSTYCTQSSGERQSCARQYVG